MVKRKIGVHFTNGCSAPGRLLETIERLLPCEFVLLGERQVAPAAQCDAMLLFGATRERAMEVASSGLRCLAFVGGSAVTTGSPLTDVALASTPYLPECLRGRVLADKAIERIRCLRAEAGDEVVARKGDDILWIHRKERAASVDLVAMQPPDLADNSYLYDHLKRDDWARLLPILHFLQGVSGWERPPVRACFMFDDPNLHWKSYGFIRFDQLAEHARKHNYHAVFATIPIDFWYVSRQTAALFRENKNRLSLVIHGNDHTSFELTQTKSHVKRRALAAQAVRRAEQFERASGLEIPRLMVAPHGACNHDMATALLQTGFEAACISRGSLMVRNPTSVWPASVGMAPAEFLGNGLPVMPRFDIRRDESCAIFAAFLGQPIILRAHHWDLAEGLGLLERWAHLINTISNVQWTDVGSIGQTNFCTRRADGVLHLRMYSRKVRLKVPQGCTQISVERPWLNNGGEEDLIVQRAQGPERILSHKATPLSVTAGEEMVIHSSYPSMIAASEVKIASSTLWAVVRRQLCMTRDRLRPLVDKLMNGSFLSVILKFHSSVEDGAVACAKSALCLV